MTDMFSSYLWAYCERAGEAGLFAEPLNAVSNLGFVIAAVLAARSLADARRGRKADLWALVVCLMAIGVGSALWHLVPTAQTQLMDVIPIGVFTNLYLLSALRRLFALPWRAVAGWWAAYFAACVAIQAIFPANLFNGTIMYLPTYITLGLLTFALFRRDPVAGENLRRVLAVWSISLVLRTSDVALCGHFPLGTHFLWHLLNSWVLWRLLALLITPSQGTATGRH